MDGALSGQITMQQPPLMANLADRPEQPRKWNARRFRINAAQISRSKTLTKGFPSEGNPTHHLKRMAELNYNSQSKALLFSPLYPYWPLSPTQSAPILLCRCRISIKYQWKLTVSNMADLPALFEYTKKKIENVHPLLQQQQSSWGLFFHRNHSHILRPVISVLQENSLSVLHFFIKFSFLCFFRRETAELTFCFAFLYQVLTLLLLQEENRGLRLKEELVVAAPRLQPSAIADQPDEEKLRLVSKLDGIVCSSEIVVS